ncbi:MAG: hypothetical protein HY706_00010 [Candidatus Hydrogenedentes bacterium]|nr:hypothetical protein [Candidatus Hydrogenedentota bacterium]
MGDLSHMLPKQLSKTDRFLVVGLFLIALLSLWAATIQGVIGHPDFFAMYSFWSVIATTPPEFVPGNWIFALYLVCGLLLLPQLLLVLAVISARRPRLRALFATVPLVLPFLLLAW